MASLLGPRPGHLSSLQRQMSASISFPQPPSAVPFHARLRTCDGNVLFVDRYKGNKGREGWRTDGGK
jgi:hypothetical protein